MTELERARAHLQECQRQLYHNRRLNYSWAHHTEKMVLAALSWVWEEQCKENVERNANRFLRLIRASQ